MSIRVEGFVVRVATKEASDSLTCLVDVLMTAHFPFLCESRSK